MLFVDDAAVGSLMHVASLASLAALGVMVTVLMLIIGSGAIYEAVLGTFSFASGVVAVSSLGNGVVDVAVVAVGADILDAVITAFTAAMFAFKLNALSRPFFFWLGLPHPGPGIAEWKN